MGEPKRTVVIFHPHFTLPGGAGKVALEVGERLAKNYRVVAVSQRSNEFHRRSYPGVKFEDTGGPVTSSFGFWLLLPYWYYRFAKIADSYRQDDEVTLFINVFPANWFGFVYKLFRPKLPAFYYCHEPSAFIHFPHWRRAIRHPLKRLIAVLLAPPLAVWDRFLTGKADTIFVNSKYIQSLVKMVYGLDSTVAYPGINVPEENASFQKKDYILSVGRLSKFKRFDLVIKALAAIPDKSIRLIIAGDGDEREPLRALAEELKVSERVELPGFVSDSELSRLYGEATLFVLASPGEPFGLTPVEAMAAGVPVITDKSGGPAETVVDGKTGWTIEMSEETLSATLEEALSDPVRLKTMSAAAREHGRTFTWERPTEIIERWISKH
jgi:glycosyltransferase involved in cell wall biosynthesis